MATLSASPNPARIGQAITFLGEGFAATTATAIRVDRVGWGGEVISDAGGIISNDDPADHAKGTLTLALNVAALETVTIGSRVFTFKSAITGVGNEVLVGANASASLDNLKAAINLAGTDVLAAAKTATTLQVVARLAGTDGNSIGTTETLAGAGNQWGGAVLTGGAGDPTGVKQVQWIPTLDGTYEATASDGTNSAATKVQVFASS